MKFVDRATTRFRRSVTRDEVPVLIQVQEDVTGTSHTRQFRRHWSRQPGNECRAEKDLLHVRVHLIEQLAGEILKEHVIAAPLRAEFVRSCLDVLCEEHETSRPPAGNLM